MTKTISKPRRMARTPQGASGEGEIEAKPLSRTTAEPLPASETPVPPTEPIKRQSKQDLVITMLKSGDGALLSDLVNATSWQPHTVRAALTGLKKKGHTIIATKINKVTRYNIAPL